MSRTWIVRSHARAALRATLATLLAAAGLATAAPADAPPAAHTMELGQGPAVVIVHDLGDTRLTWMPVVRKLMSHHRVVLADLPGHGDTPLPSPFSLEAAAAALDPVLAALPADSTVLIGSGVGGLVAMRAAQAHPERLRGLVLVGTALAAPMKVEDQQMRMFTDWMEQHYDEFLGMTFGRMGRDSTENMVIRAHASQVAPATIKAYMRTLLAADETRTAKSIKVPVLLVATGAMLQSGDWAAAAKRTGWEGIPVRVRTLPSAGRLVMQQQPDSLAAIVDGFDVEAVAKK